MISLLMQYVLPFVTLVLLVAAVALKIHWNGGPAALFIIFFYDCLWAIAVVRVDY